nr:hypothetical protein Iba_chr10dCG14510 [Ipomoea batatas]
MVFRQVEPSSIRLPIRPQVRVPSDSQGLVPLSPHPVAIDIPAPADVREEARQMEVEEAQQQDQQEEAPQVEETADPPATVEEQDQLPVPLRPVIPDFFRFPGIPGQLQLRDQGSLVATIQYYKNWIIFWHQIVQSLLSLLQYLASFRGVGDGGASTSGMENDPPANQEDPSLDVHRGSSHQQDPPPRNTSLEVRGGSSDQQHEPLSNPSFLLVFPLPPSQEQPPSPPNFVVLMVFRQVEPSSIRLPIRPQVRVPSDSQGLVPLSPHPVAIDIPAPADVREEAHQMEVEEARFPEFQANCSYGTKDLWLLLSSIIKTGSDFGTKLSKVYCPYSNTWPHSAELEMEVQAQAGWKMCNLMLLWMANSNLNLSSGNGIRMVIMILEKGGNWVGMTNLLNCVTVASYVCCSFTQHILMRNLLRGTICGGGSGRGRGGQDPPANQEDPSLDVHRGSSHQQVEPSSIRLPIRPQVRVPSDSHGLVPLSPHPVAIDIPAPADVREEARQMEVEEAQQQDQQEEAPQVEETADPPATVEEQDQLPVPLRPVIPDFFRFPGIPGQLQLRDQGSLVATIQYYKNWIRFWHQIVQSLLSLLQYLASFRGVGDRGASTSGMENAFLSEASFSISDLISFSISDFFGTVFIADLC